MGNSFIRWTLTYKPWSKHTFFSVEYPLTISVDHLLVIFVARHHSRPHGFEPNPPKRGGKKMRGCDEEEELTNVPLNYALLITSSSA